MKTITKMIKCPHCGAQAVYTGNPNRPFCSERCRLIDLGQWADEEYRIAGRAAGMEQAEFDTGE